MAQRKRGGGLEEGVEAVSSDGVKDLCPRGHFSLGPVIVDDGTQRRYCYKCGINYFVNSKGDLISPRKIGHDVYD